MCTEFGIGFQATGNAEDMRFSSSVAVDLAELCVTVGISVSLSKV